MYIFILILFVYRMSQVNLQLRTETSRARMFLWRRMVHAALQTSAWLYAMSG